MKARPPFAMLADELRRYSQTTADLLTFDGVIPEPRGAILKAVCDARRAEGEDAPDDLAGVATDAYLMGIAMGLRLSRGIAADLDRCEGGGNADPA